MRFTYFEDDVYTSRLHISPSGRWRSVRYRATRLKNGRVVWLRSHLIRCGRSWPRGEDGQPVDVYYNEARRFQYSYRHATKSLHMVDVDVGGLPDAVAARLRGGS